MERVDIKYGLDFESPLLSSLYFFKIIISLLFFCL
jgi:hypothetical protein